MPRIEEGKKEETKTEAPVAQPQLVEVEINLNLINSKLNYIIAVLDAIQKAQK